MVDLGRRRRRAPAWFERRVAGGARRRGRLAAATVAGQRAGDRQRRGHAARLPRRCAACGGAAARRRALRRRRSRCPRLRALVLPAPGGPLDGRRAHPARAGAAAARAGAASRWRWRHERDGDGADRRRLAADAVAARRAGAAGRAGCAGLARAPARRAPERTGRRRAPPSGRRRPSEVCDLCGIGDPRRPPPPAAPGRAADRLRLRGVLGRCAPARATTARPGSARCGCPDLDVPDDLWASFQIPIGLAFFMHSTVTECVVAMYPSPAGATESELHFESWNRMLRAQPGARRHRARHRGPDRQPPGRPAGLRDRADRPLLRADRRDQGAAGRGSPGGAGGRDGGGAASSTRCGREAVPA